jgi:hypothetical protein
MKFNSAAVWSDFPGGGEGGLKSLRLAIEANQDAASKVANGFGLAVFNKERIECFWFAMETKMELAARLGDRLRGQESRATQGNREREKNGNAAYH